MVSELKSTLCTIFKIFPIVIFVTVVLVFDGYVVYNLQKFRPIPPAISMDCDSFVGESAETADTLSDYLHNRSIMDAGKPYTPGKCWYIRKRRYFPIVLPSSIEFQHFLYFIRVVSKNYDYVEESLSMMFSPQHFYCLPIDNNSTPEFQKKMRHLGMCLLNVIVPEKMFNASDPIEVLSAHNECFKIMSKYKWEHAIITQEDDVPVQSIQTIGAYLFRLGDTARIGSHTIQEDTLHQLENYLKDGTLNGTDNVHDQVTSALVDWWSTQKEPILLCRLSQRLIYKFVEKKLTAKDFFPHPALSIDTSKCQTNHFDKMGNCVLGMENYNYALKSKKLFIRVDPHFDHGFIECLSETVYKRTFKEVI